MFTPQMQIVLALGLAAVTLLVLGYRIRYRREWHLIAGFDTGQMLRDPEGFGTWTGSLGLLLGSITLGAAALALARPDLNAVLGPAYAGTFLGATAVFVVGAVRYIF